MSDSRSAARFAAMALMIVGALGAVAAYESVRPSAHAADAQPMSMSPGSQPGNEADEKAIRASADEFVKAFNAGDAKTIGAQWAEDAQYTDESGQQFHGASGIEKEYARLFKEHPGAKILVFINSIRFLGPDIAIEKGISKVTLPKGDSTAARYSVVHARRDGKWMMVVGHDSPYVSSFGDDYLKDLAWLIGDWKTDLKGQPLRLKFEWMAQHNFIKNTFMLPKEGTPTLTGGQIIGWDPKTGTIVSWHFDAEGGFGHDVWAKEGSKWIVHAHGTLRDGSDSAATNIITPIDDNSFTWQSTKRTLDGVSLPDVPPVKIVRNQQQDKSQ